MTWSEETFLQDIIPFQVFVLLLMWFQIYSGFSGAPFTDDLNLIFYNLIYTALPPIVFGILDQDVSDDLLMSRPDLYKEGAMGLVSIWLLCPYFISSLNMDSNVRWFSRWDIFRLTFPNSKGELNQFWLLSIDQFPIRLLL